jgi:hypothetical protein
VSPFVGGALNRGYIPHIRFVTGPAINRGFVLFVLLLEVLPSTRGFFVTMSSCVRWAHSAGKVILSIAVHAVKPEEASNVAWPGRFECHSDGTAFRA